MSALNAQHIKPVAIDLFSGCGGMTLGLKQAGFNVVGAVDNDPLSVETYKHNHSEVVKVWEQDICSLSVSKMKKELGIKKGELDLLAGCPPCQGFSTLRTMKGGRRVIDARKDLVFEFLRFVEGLLPKVVMMENVPGLAKDYRMRQLVKKLEKLGYKCNYAVLNAADYGVPQRRRRLILLASQKEKVGFAKKDSKRQTVRETIANLSPTGKSGDPLHDLPEVRSERIINLIKKIPRNGGSRTSLRKREQLQCHKNFSGFVDVYGRMAWDDVAPTITGGCVNPSKGRFLHPKYNRAITLREAALLQSFPPNYFFSLTRGKYSVATMIGNALPPEFIRRQAVELAKHLQP